MVTVADPRRALPAPSAGALFALLRDGAATSRSDLVRVTGLAPSTVSVRVNALLRSGYVTEDGSQVSTGGRRPRRLAVRGDTGMVGAAEVRPQHVRLALSDLTGVRLDTVELPLDVARGPAALVGWVCDRLAERARAVGRDPATLRGLGFGLPAPIEAGTQRVVLPARMPGWDGADVRALVAAHLAGPAGRGRARAARGDAARIPPGIPVVLGNDADLAAVAEQAERGDVQHLLAVLLGDRIGCGIIASGRLHRGAGGGAGEISHRSVDGDAAIPCTCTNPHCLEAVASGDALARRIVDAGGPVLTTEQIVDLARDGDPAAHRLLREAGVAIGGVLAGVLDFFNPQVLVLDGPLSRSAPLVAAIQGVVYERCLPLSTRGLEIAVSTAGADAGVRGLLALLLARVLDPAEVDRSLGIEDHAN